MPLCFIYTRVSTDEQHLSPEWQEEVCRTYYETNLQPRGYALAGVFPDHGQSAYKIAFPDREVGSQVFQQLQKGDILVVAKQDRLWRQMRDKENCQFFWKHAGIDYCALDMSIDTSTAAGKFASTIVSAQAQWESDVKSERMKAAFAIRRKRKVPGVKHPPPGWQWDPVQEQLVPDENERKLVSLIFRWREQGVRSIRKTCKWLTEEGVRRKCGTKYHEVWVTRAYRSLKQGWPCEGYLTAFWKGKGFATPEERDQYRLAQAGKKKKWFIPDPGRAHADDLEWLSATYSVEVTRASSPVEPTPQTP